MVTSMKALHEEMYRQLQGSGGCYKLLNATGPVGSQGSPDFNQDIDAPLIHYSDLKTPLQRDVAVLVPVKHSVAFLQQLQATQELQQHIKGVLIDDSDPPASYSTVGPFPLAEYAPYNQADYVWNKAAGSNAYPSSTSWFPAPVFLLSPELAEDARQRTAYNSKHGPKRMQYHARMKLTMSTAAANSSGCIAAGNCKPLGGYSVWSALPPLPAASITSASGSSNDKPIILVVAQMDSIDMFHDSIQGTDSPLSGLVAMLGALHVMHKTAASSSYSKRVIFLALAGEPWGYMGSRRLLYEAATGSNSTEGLDMDLVKQVIEVGQVGRLTGSSAGAAGKLYAHYQSGAAFGDASDMVAALHAAAADEATAVKVEIADADAANPGIPPSSLMSFLRVKPSIQGLVLAEFDQAFTNPYYGSRFDNGSVNVEGVAATAAVLAAAVHRLAGGDPAAVKVNATELQEVVAGYISCIIMPAPGYACPLAASIMAPDYTFNKATHTRSYAPRQYIGVLPYIPELQSPVGKNNFARFLWNVMAFDSSDGQRGAVCDPFKNKCPAGQVCAGWRSNCDAKYMGTCLNATVQYVPSFSTKVACQSCSDFWQVSWQVTDAADAWNSQYNWPPDPMWTESDWPLGVPDLQLYLHESEAVEKAVLAAGLLVTAAVAAASFAAKAAFEKHLKSS